MRHKCLFGKTCLLAALLQSGFQGVRAKGRSYSDGVESPAELEEQEESFEVLEEASPAEVPRPVQPQVFLGGSFAPLPLGDRAPKVLVAPPSPKTYPTRDVHSASLMAVPANKEVPRAPRPLPPTQSFRRPVPEPSQLEKTEEANMMQTPVKQPWPPPSKRTKCHPKCMEGRGVCNDNVCFCKSPYTGVSCQHKISDLSRFPIPLVIGFGVFCAIVGSILARIIYWIPPEFWLCFPTPSSRTAPSMVKKEVWHPPEIGKTKKDSPKSDLPPDHKHLVSHDDHT